jgi:hypothetical protein
MLFRVRFLCFMAGILRSFKAITMHIVLTDIPIVRLIFQRGPELRHQFTFKDFTFRLIEHSLQDDKFVYVVSTNETYLLFFFFGVDTSEPCGPVQIWTLFISSGDITSASH